MCSIRGPRFVTIANNIILVSETTFFGGGKIFQVNDAGTSPFFLRFSCTFPLSIHPPFSSRITHPMFQGKRVYFTSMLKEEKQRNTGSTTACVALYWMRRPILVSLSIGEIMSLKKLHFSIQLCLAFVLFCFD